MKTISFKAAYCEKILKNLTRRIFYYNFVINKTYHASRKISAPGWVFAFIEQWIHAISNLRNICAHHSRLWNRRFTIKVPVLRNPAYPYLKNPDIDNSKLYAQLCQINYLLGIISPDCNFVHNLKELLMENPQVNIKTMGFPKDWVKEEIWK